MMVEVVKEIGNVIVMIGLLFFMSVLLCGRWWGKDTER